MSSIDRLDLAILRELVRDGRQSLAELAGRVRTSRASAYARYHRLVEAGVIEGVSARIRAADLGLPVSAVVLLSGGQANAPELREALRAIPQVEYAAYVAGRADILLVVRVAGIDELKDVLLERLRALPGVRATETLLVIDEVVRRQVLPD